MGCVCEVGGSSAPTGNSPWGPFRAGRGPGYREGALAPLLRVSGGAVAVASLSLCGLGSGLLAVACCVDTVVSEASTHVVTGQWVKVPGFGPPLC